MSLSWDFDIVHFSELASSMANPITWNYESFIKVKDQFDLGELVTEQRHAKSSDLADWASKDITRALEAFREIDLAVITKLSSLDNKNLEQLRKDCHDTWQQGGRVFVSGCGSTGRMAFVLEKMANAKGANRVIAVMAGGDIALVHSIAGFEDSTEFGARQLREAGFGHKDLLIACTEGGETPFVLGTVHEALKLSAKSAYFVFCNPTEVLRKKVERSRVIIENKKVIGLDLNVGPMALTGSTRLQATTAQTLVVGWALVHEELSFAEFIADIETEVKSLELNKLEPLIEIEADFLAANKVVNYQSRGLPMAVFTDIAERGPTFSLLPMQPVGNAISVVPQFSVLVPGATSAQKAWSEIFGRSPTALGWKDLEVSSQLSLDYLLQYDWSESGQKQLEQKIAGAQTLPKQTIIIDCDPQRGQILLKLGPVNISFNLGTRFDWVKANVLLKIILNTHSTLVMGRIGRFHKNLMTFVRPTNGKLIDRSMRYVKWLLKDDGKMVDDDVILKKLFSRLDADSKANQSVVMNTYLELKK
jgi:N-acetylmuramic acid 6-phosphate etherase